MPKNLIGLVITASRRMTAVATITKLVGNQSDLDSERMLAIANTQITDMANATTPNGAWRALQKTLEINTIQDVDLYALPSDFSYSVYDTEWNNSNQDFIRGALSAAEWEYLTKGRISVSPFVHYRLIGNNIQIFPKPSQSDIKLSFVYVSKNAILDVDGITTKEFFSSDNDTILLNEEAFIRGIIWRWKRMSGLDFSIEYDEYEKYLKRIISQDSGIGAYSLITNKNANYLINQSNIPDSGYGA